MASIKLELSDCLADSPQTRALIGVFLQDAQVLTNYARGLDYAFQRVTSAQNELTAATQALAQHLREFDNQQFTLSTENDYISSVMKELATKIDQVATFNMILQTQLTENAAYNSGRFVEKHLMNFQKLRSEFVENDRVHQEAMKRAAKLSKRKVSESTWQESTDHLHAARKSFHGSSMNFCSILNLLQSRKKTGLLDPLVEFVQSQVGFFKMGMEISQPELEEYLNKLNMDLKDIETNTIAAEKENLEQIDRLDADSTRVYIPDPPPSMDFPELPVNEKLTQISGYLFARSLGVFTNNWKQRYYFTQGGNLIQQERGELAGSPVMDLDGCLVALTDCDDRRYVFQINSQDGKQNVVLQAESKHSCMQWISTIKNISKGLYLADDPSKAAELMQAASRAPEQAQSPPAESTETQATAVPAKVERSSSQSSDFESKHEAFKPSAMFERLKNAASSLVAPLNRSDSDKGQSSRTASGEGDNVSRDATESELEAIANTAGYPILFDLPSPATQKPDETQKKPKSGDGGTSPARENPFTGDDATKDSSTQQQSGETSGDPESNFHAMYVVRFIGCRQVETEIHNGYAVISESIRSIMAARALHNIFSMNELHLVVTDNSVRLIDPATQLCRDSFFISEIVMAASHRENTRLIGFISRRSTHGTSNTVNMCYVFESNNDGADVCCAITTAQVMVRSLIEQDEIERQKELESDLEEQSKMLAHASLEEEGENDDVTNEDDSAAKIESEDLTMRDT